jgi:hypothetical protein
MHPDTAWLSLAIYRFNCQITDLLAASTANTNNVAEFNTAHQDVVVSAAQVLDTARSQGRSLHEEVAIVFDEILRANGHSEQECSEARNICRSVLLMADKLLDDSDQRRGDDPAQADPGGGMRGPDHWEDDDRD